MNVFQTDRSGHYVATLVADESPLEEGVFLVPAGCVTVAPPETWPDNEWPRWNGASWDLVTKPSAVEPDDPVTKLQNFLAANPDVAAILKQGSV
jgi:hypothetical protein